MTFEYQKYKREKSSIIPIEEIYTDLDINVNDPYVPNVGYRFDSPRRWCNDGSKNKSIGIRDLHLTPSSGDIRCRFLMFGHAKIRGQKWTWNTDISLYEADDATQEDDVVNFRSISDYYNIQLTPQNNFEEIITNMLEFINAASWKSTHNVSNAYKVYKPSHQDNSKVNLYFKRKNDGSEEALTYITNKRFLKTPLIFNYYFDSDSCNFECKNTNSLRWVYMSDATNSFGDETENEPMFEAFSSNSHHYYNLEFDEIILLNSKKDNHDIIYQTDGKPYLYSSELLLIIERNDKSSIKAVYDLFNQKMPDINTLPVILNDGVYYVIPFIDMSFQSHFKFGEVNSSNLFTNVQSVKTFPGFTTNLKLDNVWDRLHLIYHASFAETRHRIIGRNGDHWDTPNKQFIVPSGDQDQFYIRFTTDGTHNILPIGCHFNVDLTFILNPTNNTATGVKGNHDKFPD